MKKQLALCRMSILALSVGSSLLAAPAFAFDDIVQAATTMDPPLNEMKYIDDLSDGKSGDRTSFVFLGQNSGNFLSTGIGHTAVGVNALKSIATGTFDVAAGFGALQNSSGGVANIALGSMSLQGATGNNNIAIGYQSLLANTGDNNIGIGYQSLIANTAGTYNVAAGDQAMNANTTGSFNTAFGAGAMAKNQIGASNTAIGYQALHETTNVDGNTAAGSYAMTSTTTGAQNTAVGDRTLEKNTRGSYNLAVGAYAMNKSTTGQQNVAIGYRSLYNNDGDKVNYRTAIGAQTITGTTPDNAKYDSAFGYGALQNYGGSPWNYSSAFGWKALNNAGFYNNNSPTNNIVFGADTMGSQNTFNGIHSVAFGYGAGKDSFTPYDVLALGYSAYNKVGGEGAFDQAVGAFAMGNATGSRWSNLAIGYSALANCDICEEETAVGAFALLNYQHSKAKADYDATGWWSSDSDRALYASTAIGYQTLMNNLLGTGNTAVGYKALYSGSTGSYNTAVGATALAYSIGSYNTAVGSFAMSDTATTTGDYNIALGYNALNSNTGSRNIALGAWAICPACYSTDHTTTGSDNVGIGTVTLAYAGKGAARNVAVGTWSLQDITSGTDNVAVGTSSGLNLKTGSFNTFIGYNAMTNVQNVSNATAIGSGSIVNQSDTIMLGSDGSSGIVPPVNYIFSPVNLTVTSDGRLKRHVEDLKLGQAFISKLRPVSYSFKSDKKTLHYGLIAQEVEGALDKPLQDLVESSDTQRSLALLTRENNKERTFHLSYSELISPLIKAVQELAGQVSSLKTAAAEQKRVIEAQERQIETLTALEAALREEKKMSPDKAGAP